jgi:uncharacterized tellurite resistance protein B-like protein
MTLDYLVKAREKQKNQEVAYLIPYNCILLGKKLIQKAEYFELSQVLTNKNLITKSDIEDLQKQGKKTQSNTISLLNSAINAIKYTHLLCAHTDLCLRNQFH